MGPFSILQRMMDPANASHGDAVFTQEALDRVITQLMEQNQGSNAPGPASEAAIRSLPKKKVEPDMLDDKGKAECSICMDSVELGEQVTVLPCTHWFHEACITAWLKEHDTCPHCRKSISPPPEANGSASRGSGQPSRPPRRSSSSSMPGSWQTRSGMSRNPFVVDDTSPGPQDIRAARHRYYSRQHSEDLERRDTRDRRSPRSTPSSDERRRHRRSDSHQSNTNNNNNNNSNSDGGGFTGWVRSLGGGRG
jgi:E3 ubiquitin-protein ligase RNF115/126